MPSTRDENGADSELDELRAERERYRTATEDALQQLDWCIGYFVGANKPAIAKALGTNRAHIRTQIRRKPLDVPVDPQEG